MSEYECFRCGELNHWKELYSITNNKGLEELVCKKCIKQNDKINEEKDD